MARGLIRFGAKPANDSNGKPINYTVKEEDVPDGWTPHYLDQPGTLRHNLLAFQSPQRAHGKDRGDQGDQGAFGRWARIKQSISHFTVTLLEYLDSNEVTSDGGEPGCYPLGGTIHIRRRCSSPRRRSDLWAQRAARAVTIKRHSRSNLRLHRRPRLHPRRIYRDQ